MPPARPGCPILPGLLRRDRVSSEPHRGGGLENLRTLERRGLQILPLHAGPCRKTCEVAGFSSWIARTLMLRVERRSISTRALSSGGLPRRTKVTAQSDLRAPYPFVFHAGSSRRAARNPCHSRVMRRCRPLAAASGEHQVAPGIPLAKYRWLSRRPQWRGLPSRTTFVERS